MIKWIIVITTLIAAIYFGFKWLDKSSNHTPPTSAVLSVTGASPRQGTIAQQVNVTGMTIPREEIVVITELSDLRVKEVFADVGDVVKKNRKLVTLDSESLSNQLAQLQSDYDRARDEFDRVDAIKNTGAVSLESVNQKLTAMQSAKARLDDAQLNLKRSMIIAPEAGMIFERNAALGALVNANEPLFRIARHGDIELEASIPEDALHNIKVGQLAEVKLTGAEESIHGTIRLITPRIDNASRTASIRISLPKNNKTPVGLFASAKITTQEKHGIILPTTAIQHDSNGNFVWKLDETKKAVRSPVKVLLQNNDSVMIDDIPTDIMVIARAGAFIKEGDVVNLVEDK